MYAVITTGGKQYKVAGNDVLEIERLSAAVGDRVEFPEVLAIGEEDQVKTGTPFLPNACVQAEVVGHYRGRKITVFKMKRRKGYRRKQGHRREITKVKITGIFADRAQAGTPVEKPAETPVPAGKE